MNAEVKLSLEKGWLGCLKPDLAESILKAGKLQRAADGEIIARLGDQNNAIHGVISGMARMFVTMNEQPAKFCHVAVPGFWFGEYELIDGSPRIMEVEASGETLLLRLERRAIDRIAEASPEIWQGFYLLANMNLGTAIGAGDDLMIRSSRQRFVALLLRLSAHRNAYQGVQPVDTIPATWAEVAEAANLSRSKVASLLSEFSSQGLIRTEKGSIVLLKPNELHELLMD